MKLSSALGPRRRDAGATRAAILAAAKSHFARLGYDTATLRDIAADAGADVALVKRYFGAKKGLFAAALDASFADDRPLAWERDTFPKEVAEMMAGDARGQAARTRNFEFLLRAATSSTTASMASGAVEERFLAPIREWLGGGEAQARARVLVATFIGFLVERLIRDEHLQGPEREVFINRVTALFEALVSDRGGR